MKASQCEWLSRLSFGTSLVALAAAAYSGCQDAGLGKEPAATSLVSVKKAEPKAAAISPDRLPKLDPEEAPSVEDKAKAEEKAKVEAPSDKGAEPAPEKEQTLPDLEVQRLVVTHGIEDREPLKATDLVAGAQPVYAFVELSNPADTEQDILITFEHESGAKVGFVPLKVPAAQKRWRTWGRTAQIKKAGHWSAVVSVKDGPELQRGTFEVSEPSEPSEPAEVASGS